jgi:phosphopentomutase
MQAAGYRVSTWLGKEGYDWITKIGRETNRSDLLVSSDGHSITAKIHDGKNDLSAVTSSIVESASDIAQFDQNLFHHIMEDFLSHINNDIKILSIGTLFGLDTAAHKFGEEGYNSTLDDLDKLISPYLDALSSDNRLLVVVGSDHGISFGLGTADHRRTSDDLEVKYSPLFFCNSRFTSKAIWMANPTTSYSLVDVKPTISRLRRA